MSTQPPAAELSESEKDDASGTRRGAVYFDDGDIVLSVKDEEQDEVLYRIDTKFLARHSPVFATMFSLPFAPGVNEEHEGVPIVHLDDEQAALEDLIRFIYNPVYVYWIALDARGMLIHIFLVP